jgi:hypothetical protein
MLSRLFKKSKPTPTRPKPRTKAERREAMLQRLRAKHPGWSDAKLLHYAATAAAQPVVSERAQARARWQADVDAAMADGARLLERVNANIVAATYSIAVPLADGSVRHVSQATFQALQSDMAQQGEREKLADLNAIAREHSLPEVG